MSRKKKRRPGGGRGVPLATRSALVMGGASLLALLLLSLLARKGTPPQLLLLVSLAFGAGVAGLAWMEGTQVARLFNELALAVGKLARGDFGVRFRGGRKIQESGRLVRQLEELAGNLREGVVEEELAKIREKEARLLGRVRRKMMPEAFSEDPAWETGGLFLPGKRGGGDFLEYLEVPGKLYLAAGSAQGAGAAAGMVMVLGKTLLREWLERGEEPPGVLEKLNKRLKENLVEGACLTLTLLEAEREGGGEVRAWGLGLQAPLYFFGRGEIRRIGLEGIALGLDEGRVFSRALQPKAVKLQRGQRLVLVTPGIYSNLSPSGEEYGEARLEDTLARHGPKNTLVFVDMVGGEMEDFLGGEAPDEDVVLLSVRYGG